MGRQGKKWMKKDFSWESACEKTLEAYKWINKKGRMPDHIYMQKFKKMFIKVKI